MKVRAPDRVQSGALTPEILWRHYAGNKVAPLRRQFTGSITPETKWLLNAESSQRFQQLMRFIVLLNMCSFMLQF